MKYGTLVKTTTFFFLYSCTQTKAESEIVHVLPIKPFGMLSWMHQSIMICRNKQPFKSVERCKPTLIIMENPKHVLIYCQLKEAWPKTAAKA